MTDKALITNYSGTLKLTSDQCDEILRLAHEGKTLSQIIRTLGIDTKAFWEARQKHPDFNSALTKARLASLEILADDLISIPDDVKDVQRARLKSDNFKWLLTKRLPETYGERINLTVEVPDIANAIQEARRRTVPVRFQQSEEVTDILDMSTGYDAMPTDSESVDIEKEDDIDIFS